MTAEKDTSPRELHERLLKQALKEIGDTIGDLPLHPVVKMPATPKNASGTTLESEGAPVEEQHSGPDKINEIRNEVAATHPPEILAPENQKKVLEIVKEKNDTFERDLRRLVPPDSNQEALLSKKFKEELMDNINKLLTEKQYAFSN